MEPIHNYDYMMINDVSIVDAVTDIMEPKVVIDDENAVQDVDVVGASIMTKWNNTMGDATK